MRVAAYFCLAIILSSPQLSFGCRPNGGYKYTVPTEEEKSAQADLVFSGTVIEVRDAPELKEIAHHPYPIMLTIKIQKWEKGTGSEFLQVVDTGGTDCDGLLGISHIQLPYPGGVPSSAWRVFAKRSNGHIFVITANIVK